MAAATLGIRTHVEMTRAVGRSEKGTTVTDPFNAAQQTDLERRVLAHERILQELIAHMAEAEPKFLARLNQVFVDTMQLSRREHDYTDTDSYAEYFVREVVRLHNRPTAVLPARGGPVPKRQNASGPNLAAVVTQFRVRRRTGIWEVTRGGVFYGDYVEEEHAIAAARSGIRDIVAAGGSAELAGDTASMV